MKAIPFDIKDGLVTNEYAFYNPSAVGIKKSGSVNVTSGSLFLKGGVGWTGVPDDVGPNVGSTNGTNSAIFRMETIDNTFKNVSIKMKVFLEAYVSLTKVPSQGCDGFHIWPRYIDEATLYVVSVNRRNNTCVIKKKTPPGPSNGGTYYPLTKDMPYMVPMGQWQDVEVRVSNTPDGGVAIILNVNGKIIASCLDNGFIGGPPLLAAAKIGLRGDNANLQFSNFTVDDI